MGDLVCVHLWDDIFLSWKKPRVNSPSKEIEKIIKNAYTMSCLMTMTSHLHQMPRIWSVIIVKTREQVYFPNIGNWYKSFYEKYREFILNHGKFWYGRLWTLDTWFGALFLIWELLYSRNFYVSSCFIYFSKICFFKVFFRIFSFKSCF